MLTDTLTTTRYDIIDMICCRETYGHTNQICNHFFWSLLGNNISIEEIEDYSTSFLLPSMKIHGYDIEDAEDFKETLTNFKIMMERTNNTKA